MRPPVRISASPIGLLAVAFTASISALGCSAGPAGGPTASPGATSTDGPTATATQTLETPAGTAAPSPTSAPSPTAQATAAPSRPPAESYTACGCGCCGEMVPPQNQCLYRSKGDDLAKIIAADKARKDPVRCAKVGCSAGVKYTYCH